MEALGRAGRGDWRHGRASGLRLKRFKFKQRAQSLAQDRMVLDDDQATPRIRDDHLTEIGSH